MPFAMDVPDRVPKERYFDPDFFRLEGEHLWPRVWQMACRLEQIPHAGDYVEYEILDQSVVVVRGDDMEVRAFENTCRHRGVKLVDGPRFVRVQASRVRSTAGATESTAGTRSCRARARSPSTTWMRTTSTSCRCGARRGAGARGSTSTTTRRRCARCIEPFATVMDAWKLDVDAGRVVVRLPAAR